MKKSVCAIIALIFLVGLGVFLYPYIYNYAFDKKASEVIVNFIKNLPAQSTKPAGQTQTGEDSEKSDTITIYPELYEALAEYNEALANGAQISLNSNTAYKQFPVSLRDYGFDDEMIGYITLPTIDMELPLYLGANDKNLKAGVAVMGYTSAPIGGENTNCVIAGHSSWNGAGRFKYIENLKTGDEVFITTFWGKRKYTVSHMAVIDDNDFASIYIQTGKDMVTFMTCHYQNGVKMRHVVFCEFAEYPVSHGLYHSERTGQLMKSLRVSVTTDPRSRG